MSRIGRLYDSTIGKKFLVALTGLIMVGFLLGHVTGNLKVFVPDPEPGVPDIDVYAEFLKTMGEPMLPHMAGLWITRLILLSAVFLHIICVIQLSRRNKAARPEKYEAAGYVQASLSARLMLVSGLVLLAFIVFHILHFTTGTIDPANFEEGKVFDNLTRAFEGGTFVLLYLIAMVSVGFHIYHGVWSVFQTLGVDNPDRNKALRGVSVAIAVALFLGFSSVPLAFFTGVFK